MFSPTSKDLVGEGYDAFLEWMKAQRTIGAVQRHEGAYHVFRADSVRRVLTDSHSYSSDRRHLMPPASQLGRGNLTMMDPPDHSRMRRLVNQAFTPSAVAHLQSTIEEASVSLVSKFGSDPIDIVEEVAYPLPIIIISRLLGLPEENLDLYRKWSLAFSAGDASVMEGMHLQLRETARERRSNPKDDLITSLTSSEVEGQYPSDDEVASLVGLILLAGHVTTTSVISASIYEWATKPYLYRPIVEGKAQQVVDEVLRFRPAFSQVTRISRKKQLLDGVAIPKGAVVTAWIVSANFDEALNHEPETFLVDRPNRRMLTFGHGIHYCLGAPLARLEASIILKQIASVYRKISIAKEVKFYPQPTLAMANLIVKGEKVDA